jgi:hypothetical protein
VSRIFPEWRNGILENDASTVSRLKPKLGLSILKVIGYRFRSVKRTQQPGTDVMILKIFSPKTLQKIGVFDSKQS